MVIHPPPPESRGGWIDNHFRLGGKIPDPETTDPRQKSQKWKLVSWTREGWMDNHFRLGGKIPDPETSDPRPQTANWVAGGLALDG